MVFWGVSVRAVPLCAGWRDTEEGKCVCVDPRKNALCQQCRRTRIQTMKISLLKRKRKVSVLDAPSAATAASLKMARKCRYRQRELSKAFKDTSETNESVNNICTICQDAIEDPLDAEVTACGHVFHYHCAEKYRKSQVVDGLARVQIGMEDGILTSQAATMEIARLMVEYEIGKNCPNCRCRSPFLHMLALRTANRSRCYKINNLRVELTATDVLAFATRS